MKVGTRSLLGLSLLLLLTSAAGLQLSGPGKGPKAESGRAKGFSIPMWGFLPSAGTQEDPNPFHYQHHHHKVAYVPDASQSMPNHILPPQEILDEAEDISTLLSPGRGMGTFKRASSPAIYGLSPDSSRKSDGVKRSRPYDVPQIECPLADDGMERFACPTPDSVGRYRCVDDHVLCDGFIDCPNAEDENRQACMFYKTTKAHLDVLADALLRWARGR